mgnify:CR=1 FL=1
MSSFASSNKNDNNKPSTPRQKKNVFTRLVPQTIRMLEHMPQFSNNSSSQSEEAERKAAEEKAAKKAAKKEKKEAKQEPVHFKLTPRLGSEQLFQVMLDFKSAIVSTLLACCLAFLLWRGTSSATSESSRTCTRAWS